jgi:cysteine desulfurase
MFKPIYLDNNATTPVDEAVRNEMWPYFLEDFGNPSSPHFYGLRAKAAVDAAQRKILSALKVDEGKVILTSGATESINLGLQGIAFSKKGAHIITVLTEHKAVLDTCKYLEGMGTSITLLPVDPNGLINLDGLKNAITDQTELISVMHVNNETGVIQPIPEIAHICHQNNILFMSDLTASLGKVSINVKEMGIDLVTLSAHKICGPKGSGALYINKKAQDKLNTPMIHGGGHQYGLRSGTYNVPGIVGLSKAMEIIDEINGPAALKEMRDMIEDSLEKLGGIRINGRNAHRCPNVSNLTITGVGNKELFSITKNQLAFSTGSACNSASTAPSHVLTAMGLSAEEADSTIRLSLGRCNTKEDIKSVVEILTSAINRIRKYKMEIRA